MLRLTPETTIGDACKRLARCYRRSRRERVDWVRMLMDPIARILADATEREVEVIGPQGIGCRVSFHCFKPGVRAKDATHIDGEKWKRQFEDDNCLSATFEPGELRKGTPIRHVNYEISTGEFQTGTIGYLNGFNHPAEAVPADMPIRDLARFLS